MREKTRHTATAKFQLESLDARTLPSAMSMALAEHAMMMRQVHLATHVQPNFHAALHFRPAAFRVAPRLMAARPVAVEMTSAVPVQFSGTIHYTGGVTTAVTPAPAAVATQVSSSVGGAMTFAIRPPSATPTATTTTTSTTPVTATPTTTSTSATTTTTDVSDVENGPLAKGGQGLVELYVAYQAFVQGGGSGTFTPPPSAASIEIVGSDVGVDVRGSGDINAFAAALANLGMQVQATNAPTMTVEGLVPIAQLVNVAQLPQTIGLTPIYRPQRN